MVPVPLCGTFGMTLAMAAALAGGAAVLAPARPDPAALAATLRERGVTHWVTGDDLLARVLDAAGPAPFGDVRFTGFASFHPGAEPVARRAEAAGLRPRALYGSSEVQAIYAVAGEAQRFTPGGMPVSPAASVTADADGRLCFAGPSLFTGYLGDPAATEGARRDAVFRSSDLGMVGEAGFAFLGRRDDALRLSGFLVQPAEIEAVLEAVDGVEAAVVIGAAGGTRAVAFVRGGDAAALRAAAEASLPRHKRPALIAPMDALPVAEGPNGAKLRRRDLRDVADRLLAEAAVPA
ncbi:AMP-binding protein [Roseomonas sp. CCTCC AB2023176]|uniref:AMP-binding protein n=1 Tax=Roseomonas sp. CCTCC AB2023176 TaxID=3342640 RepID=UPI0035DD63D0